MDKVLIYRSADKQAQVEVTVEGETVWLSQKQIAIVFGTEVPAISKHIQNIYKSKELDRTPTISKMEIVQKEGKRLIKRTVELYNLDMILSVGYRVSSQRATNFRIWATKNLKEHLTKGYTINRKRLKDYPVNITPLLETIKLIQHSGNSEQLHLNEAKGLLDILGNYAHTLLTLSKYDSDSLKTDSLSNAISYEIKYSEAHNAIAELRTLLIAKKEASKLFGNEKDDSFKGILGNIIQTFDGKYLYPSIEEQAAHLLYFIIKNHPFSDGNKRIGAFLFIWFLERNKHRVKKSGEAKINDNGLTALALLVAQSDPAQKDLMIKLVVNLVMDI